MRKTIIIGLSVMLSLFLILIIVIIKIRPKETTQDTTESYNANGGYRYEVEQDEEAQLKQEKEEITEKHNKLTNNTYDKLSDKQQAKFNQLYSLLLNYNKEKELLNFQIIKIEDSFLYITITYKDNTYENVVVAWSEFKNKTDFVNCMSEAEFTFYHTSGNYHAPAADGMVRETTTEEETTEEIYIDATDTDAIEEYTDDEYIDEETIEE